MAEPGDMTWSERELEIAVMSYLAEHPEAMDTTDGIAEWWLMRQRIRVDLAALSKTLSRMTNEGVLEKVGTGENARYRLKSEN